MPELPEVETIRRGLQKRLVGARIVGLRVREVRLRTPIVVSRLRSALVGQRIDGVGRRSKYLLVYLGGSHVLVVHLGMSGRLVLVSKETALLPHTHVRLDLGPVGELRFVDARRFGMLFVVAQNKLDQHPRFAKLGPEPLDPGFEAGYLHGRARASRRPIKNFLMDAEVVAGLGNIYVTEALHRARVHPTSRAGRLGSARWSRIRNAIRDVLEDALRAGGTTLQDFRGAGGELGRFGVQLRVYGREGEACTRCGRVVRRIVQAGRSTFYCPGCQH